MYATTAWPIVVSPERGPRPSDHRASRTRQLESDDADACRWDPGKDRCAPRAFYFCMAVLIAGNEKIFSF